MSNVVSLNLRDKVQNDRDRGPSGIGKSVFTRAITVCTIPNILNALSKTNAVFSKDHGLLSLLHSNTNKYLSLENPQLHKLCFSSNAETSAFKRLVLSASDDNILSMGLTKTMLDLLKKRSNKTQEEEEQILKHEKEQEQLLKEFVTYLKDAITNNKLLNFFEFVKKLDSLDKNKLFKDTIISELGVDFTHECLIPYEGAKSPSALLSQSYREGEFNIFSLKYNDWQALLMDGSYIGVTRDSEVASSYRFLTDPSYKCFDLNDENGRDYIWLAVGMETFRKTFYPSFICRARLLRIKEDFSNLGESLKAGVCSLIDENSVFLKFDLVFKLSQSLFNGENCISTTITEGSCSPSTSCIVCSDKFSYHKDVDSILEDYKSNDEFIKYRRAAVLDKQDKIDTDKIDFISHCYGVCVKVLSNIEEICFKIRKERVLHVILTSSDEKEFRDRFLSQYKKDPSDSIVDAFNKYLTLPDWYKNLLFDLLNISQIIASSIAKAFEQGSISDSTISIVEGNVIINKSFDPVTNIAVDDGTNIYETIGDVMYIVSKMDTILAKGASSAVLRMLSAQTYSPNWMQYINRTSPEKEGSLPPWLYGLASGFSILLTVNGKIQNKAFYSHRLTDRTIAHIFVDTTAFENFFTVADKNNLFNDLKKLIDIENNKLLSKATTSSERSALEAMLKTRKFSFLHRDELDRIKRESKDSSIQFNQVTRNNEFYLDLDHYENKFYQKQIYEDAANVELIAAITNISIKSKRLIQFIRIDKVDLKNTTTWTYKFLGSCEASNLLVIDSCDEDNTPEHFLTLGIVPSKIERWKYGSLKDTVKFLLSDKNSVEQNDSEKSIDYFVYIDPHLKEELRLFMEEIKNG